MSFEVLLEWNPILEGGAVASMETTFAVSSGVQMSAFMVSVWMSTDAGVMFHEASNPGDT
jgi:hypothetical protein